MTRVYEQLANSIQARINCDESGNAEWFARHSDTISQLVSDFLPSGSGFDNGTRLDLNLSTGNRLVFHTSFHHMNDVGYYDGWTEHTVTVTPSFIGGFDIKVSGRNRSDIKDYIGETFSLDLSTKIEWSGERYVNC